MRKTDSRTCFGTGATGVGADVRHSSLRTRADSYERKDSPDAETAAVMTATNVGLDWLEFLPSDNAQQLSAWAWVRTRSDPEH